MATYEFQNLKKEYGDFAHPVVVLKVNGKDFAKNKDGLVLSDIEVELTSGYEAAIAAFTLYNVFDSDQSEFRIQEAKPYILLGSLVELALGYSDVAKEVFCGFISRVNFLYEDGDVPGIRVTAMDVKGMMMANNYSRQLAAASYGEAVKEVLEKSAYRTMSNKEIIKKIHVDDTPDKLQNETGSSGASSRTIEMVCESDYEFIVKAAKKYNYEFFSECGTVYFRKAKSNPEILMELGPVSGLRNFNIEYDITGLVETVEARSMDNGKGKVIQAKQTFRNKISIGNKAMKYIKKSSKVYLDPTITSRQEADNRVQSLMEEISYRFGTLECDCIGIPELLPGHFIRVTSLGNPPENKFYLVGVRHLFSEERGFETKLIGKAASIGEQGLGGGYGII